MSYLILAVLFLTVSTARATEDSLRKAASYDEIYSIVEDLYASAEDAEQAIEDLEALMLAEGLSIEDIEALPGITTIDAFSISHSDTLNWSYIRERLLARQATIVSSLNPRVSTAFWRSRSRVQLDPSAYDEKGYNDGRILGNPFKVYDRLLLSQYGLAAGILHSKDAGERNTFDHIRGYLQLHESLTILGSLRLEQAIAGDYSLGFGSGLLFSSGGMIGKSNEVIDAVEPSTRNVKGYLSSSIASGFRGGSATFTIGGLRNTLFVSSRSYDARLDSGVITSLPLDGYHRTESEEAKIDAARSNMLGANVAYTIADTSYRIQLGVTGYSESFDKPVETGGFAHNFSGASLSMASQHGALTYRELGISYEVGLSSYDSGDALGGTISVVYEPANNLQLSINGRYLPHDFVSRHGGTFGESTDDAQNERGVYLGASVRPFESLTLSSFVDLSSTIVPPYLAQYNFSTTDLLLFADYGIAEDMRLTLRTKWKQKSDEERRDDEIRVLGSRDQFNARLEHDWTLFDLRIRTRGEIVNVQYNNFQSSRKEMGFLVSANVKRPIGELLIPEVRVTWFNTPSYDSKLYVYENDLPGASGLAMLYGAGVRYSVLIGVKPMEGLHITAKYGVTAYSEEREFGSGITERIGKTSSKAGLQLDLHF